MFPTCTYKTFVSVHAHTHTHPHTYIYNNDQSRGRQLMILMVTEKLSDTKSGIARGHNFPTSTNFMGHNMMLLIDLSLSNQRLSHNKNIWLWSQHSKLVPHLLGILLSSWSRFAEPSSSVWFGWYLLIQPPTCTRTSQNQAVRSCSIYVCFF